FDQAGNLLGSSIGDDGYGPEGYSLAVVDLTSHPVPAIASFRVSTPSNDTFGVRRIYLESPSPQYSSFIPEDGTPLPTLSIPDEVSENPVNYEYIKFGVKFELENPVGVFADTPNTWSWGGFNSSNEIDLLNVVKGFFTVPGTTVPGLTSYIAVNAGYVANPENILLEAFDQNGNLLGSSIGNDGYGPDGYNLAVVDLTSQPVPAIASFRVSTPFDDTFGVRRIYLEPPVSTPIHYVSLDGGNVSPYTNWSGAAIILQDAVDAADAG
ncbi:MAG: hypothetical protein GY869_20650, partial [Planctomycetes bacterium]|nr:hypothetical protein [Planctomycetota bacterium]